MWSKLVAGCLLVVAAGVVASATRPPGRPGWAGPAAPGVARPPSSAAEAKLDELVGPVRFEGLPFDAAVERLREMTGANLFVDWRAFEAAGVDRKTPVDLDLPPMALSGVLRELTEAVDTPTARFGYAPADGFIVISSSDGLAREADFRVYDVRDLIESLVAEWAAGPEGERRWPADVVSNLTDVLTTAVDPETWRDNGGSTGSVRELSGRLVITQTSGGHRRVEALLAALRQPPSEAQPWPPHAPYAVALRRPVGRAIFHGVPFDEALAQLERAMGARFVVHWHALQTIGFDRRAPVDLDVSDLPAGEALRRVLLAGLDTLVWTVRDGVIVISTASDLDEMYVDQMYVRVYDVRDLVAADDAWAARLARLSPPPPPGSPRATPPAEDGGGDKDRGPAPFGRKLADAIQSTVDPPSWRDNGGTTAWLKPLGRHRLFVCQTWENHQKIDALLSALRQPNSPLPTTPPAPGAGPVTRPAATTRGQTP